MKSHGSAWIIIEESYNVKEKKLLFILSPKYGFQFVKRFTEEVYSNAVVSVDELIRAKKRNGHPSTRIGYVQFEGNFHLGNDPIYHVFKATKLQTTPGVLKFSYKILVDAVGDAQLQDRDMEVVALNPWE